MEKSPNDPLPDSNLMSHVDHLVEVGGGEALEGVPHHGEGEQRARGTFSRTPYFVMI